MASTAEIFRRVDAAEVAWCLRCNRTCARRGFRSFFAIVSRLGNGVFWYTLVFSLPIVYGAEAWLTVLRAAVVGFTGVALYKYLKERLIRERPYISFERIVPGTTVLDRYSFPSGHTLHAVSFTVVLVDAYPQLAIACVPFATLVALSRVVLGLHYPTDVLAGAAVGATLAAATLQLF